MGSLASTGAALGLPIEPTPRQVSNVVNSILVGRTNNTGLLTLTSSTSTTIISDTRIGTASVPVLTPTSATAASERAWVSNVSKGAFTVNHSNSTQSDRTFRYALVGA